MPANDVYSRIADKFIEADDELKASLSRIFILPRKDGGNGTPFLDAWRETQRKKQPQGPPVPSGIPSPFQAVPVPQPVPPPEFKPTPPAVLSQILKRLTPRPGEVEFYKGLGEALTQLVRRSPEQEEALRRSQEMRLVVGPSGEGERFMERVGGAPATGMRFMPPLAEGPTTVPQTIGRMLPAFMGIFPPLTSEEQQAQVAGVERLDPLSMMAAAAYAVPGAAQMEAFTQAGLQAAPWLGYARGAAEEAASAAARQARAVARAAGPTARRLAVGEAGAVGKGPLSAEELKQLIALEKKILPRLEADAKQYPQSSAVPALAASKERIDLWKSQLAAMRPEPAPPAGLQVIRETPATLAAPPLGEAELLARDTAMVEEARARALAAIAARKKLPTAPFPGRAAPAVARAEAAVPAAAKQPWEMRQREYIKAQVYPGEKARALGFNKLTWEASVKGEHKGMIGQALAEGKPVPPEVLADYPALAALPGEGKVAQAGKVVPKDEFGTPNLALSTKEDSAWISRTGEFVGHGTDHGDSARLALRNKNLPDNEAIEQFITKTGAIRYTPTGDVANVDIRTVVTPSQLVAIRKAAKGKQLIYDIYDSPQAFTLLEKRGAGADVSVADLVEDLQAHGLLAPWKPSPVLPTGGRTIAREAPAGVPPPSAAPPAEAIAAPPRPAPAEVPPAPPPVKPPAPPTAVGAPPPTEPPDQIIQRFTTWLHSPESLNLAEEAVRLRSKELGQRIPVYTKYLDELLEQGKPYEEALALAKSAMSGEYGRPLPTLSEGLANEFREATFAKVYEVLKDDPLEQMATAEALTNALLGRGIPRKLGTTGGSAYTRLSKVFPPEMVEAMDKGKPIADAFEDLLLSGKGPSKIEFESYSNLLRGEQIGLGLPGQAGKPTVQPDLRTALERQLDLEAFWTTFGREPSKVEFESYSGYLRGEQMGLGLPGQAGAPTVRPDMRTAFERQLDIEGFRTELAMEGAARKPPPDLAPIMAAPEVRDALQGSLVPVQTQHVVIRVLKEAGLSAMDIGNLLRANRSSFDQSFGRQMAPFIPRYPVDYAKGLAASWSATFQKGFAEAHQIALHKRPIYALYDELGLDFERVLAPLKGQVLKGEETFGFWAGGERPIQKFTGAIPWVKMSNRGFVTGINDFTFSIFERHYNNMLKLNEQIASGAVKLPPGKAFSIKKEMLDFGHMLEDLSGRARLGPLKELAPALNAGFWATRLNLGRLFTVRHLANPNPIVRKEAWKILGSFVATVAGVEILGEALGLWEVGKQGYTRGKIRLGKSDTWFDPWAGYEKFYRFTEDMVTGTATSPRTGIEHKIDRMNRTKQFFLGLAAPAVGLARLAITRKTYVGEPVEYENLSQWFDEIAPMAAADVVEAFRESGWLVGAITIPVAVLGGGVISVKQAALAEEWKKAGTYKEYGAIPTDEIEAKKLYLDGKTAAASRAAYLNNTRNADVDAKLFIVGETDTLHTELAMSAALRYIAENKIDPDSIRGVRLNKEEQEKRLKAGFAPRITEPTDRLVLKLMWSPKPLSPPSTIGQTLGEWMEQQSAGREIPSGLEPLHLRPETIGQWMERRSAVGTPTPSPTPFFDHFRGLPTPTPVGAR